MISVYRVRCHPEQRIAMHASSVGDMRFGSSYPRSSPLREEVVPLFFEGDLDGHALMEAIYGAIQAIYRDTAFKPERVLVGRFTFVELWAHIENNIRSGRCWFGTVGKRAFEEGKMTLFDTEILAVSGADHFIAAQPPLGYLMMHGVPEGAVVMTPR
jgi:hypothetical protein